ncbi:probable sodium/potassium/calcium exchanger CG1090 [Dreissena polymorpha]|uniref:Sodium/calcium exchanger membrane region domain-containing protein n=1 Tax=Dreissena polymorpha TaxID=45954 RepID=A0A9D3YYH6_DREPO|nr:probable sodium/potassium/calcium exchanger CG1090 [Dreissena polymorpha]KAH3707335.1 hypothetical protein DPMN_066737 [Dreissena polymorpha]
MARRRSSIRVTLIGVICILFLGLSFWNEVIYQVNQDSTSEDRNAHGPSRHLLATLPNCTPRAIEQFPRDLFSMKQRKEGAIILHISVAFYMFLGFALLCDDYFVPALEIICEVLHIQSDVAGATFMAAGSSAPELATSIIAVFIAKDDIGVGTVVGSAVYNIMFVISICALFAGTVVHLNWWPLLRDCVFYSLSVAALAVVLIDEEVYWFESLTFLLLYCFYILIMYYNTNLETRFKKWFKCCCKGNKNVTQIQLTLTPVKCKTDIQCNVAIMETVFVSDEASDEEEMTAEDAPFISKSATDTSKSNGSQPMQESHDTEKSVLSRPSSCWKLPLWLISLPLKLLFFVTIPDCTKPRWSRWFVVTFLMSLVWLSALSYLMVWMITIIGYTAGIADTIMGLTLIAFGVSLPDVITSLIVVRTGHGDMAVSNAVGSNVFDILVCLGVPWLLLSAIRRGEPIQVYSGGLVYATLTLLGTVAFLLLATHFNGWRLTKPFGVILMIVYLAFTALTSLYELNMFGYVHPKECLSSYD